MVEFFWRYCQMGKSNVKVSANQRRGSSLALTPLCFIFGSSFEYQGLNDVASPYLHNCSHTVDYSVTVTILSHRVLCHQAFDFKTWPGRSLFSASTNRDNPPSRLFSKTWLLRSSSRSIPLLRQISANFPISSASLSITMIPSCWAFCIYRYMSKLAPSRS